MDVEGKWVRGKKEGRVFEGRGAGFEVCDYRYFLKI